MVEKKTEYREYPKPDVNNFLQDDVKNIEMALDLIDEDMHKLEQGQAAARQESAGKLELQAVQTAVDGSLTELRSEREKAEKAIGDRLDGKADRSDGFKSLGDVKTAVEARLKLESFIDFSI